MKKLSVLSVFLVLALLLTACGSNGGSRKGSGSVSIQYPNQELAEEWLSAFVSAEDYDARSKCVTPDSLDELKEVNLNLPEGTPSVETIYKATYEDYDIFDFKLFFPGHEEAIPVKECALKRVDDGYLLCLEKSVMKTLAERYRCQPCDGTGKIASSNRVACAICNGTGVQQIPQYDPVTGAMLSQTIGCGGCGGSGFVGGGTTDTPCPHCDGDGVNVQ